jgi:large subunit ribosomal protein L24
MRVDSQDQRTIQSVESAIPLKNVRLIHALRDKKTGRTRDVIVRELVSTTPTFDPRTGKASRNRIIPVLNFGIPGPKTRQPSYKEYPGDTSRLDTETKTWVPTLQTAPFPTSVMDELRNKFSKFRTRHDEDFVLQKMAQDEAVKARAASVNTMLTPIQELNRRIRAEKRALGKPELTWEMLAKIGETIAKNKRITPEQLPAASKEDSGSTLEIVSSTTSSISEGITDDVSLDTQETTPSNTKDQGQGLS